MNEEMLIIHGITEDGNKLRPSDWIERVCSSVAAFSEKRCLTLAKNIQPCIIDGEKCLVITRHLETKNPPAFDFLMSFAAINKLKVLEDRRHGERALGE